MDLWIFDNDGTLYDDTSLNHAFSEIMTVYVSRIVGCSVEEATALIAMLKIKHQTMFSILAITREFGIDFEKAVYDTYLQLNLKDCGIVSIDTERKTALCNLSGDKIVFTNNPSGFARRVLVQVGLFECFNDCIGMEETGFLSKPDPRAFEIIHNRFQGYRQIFFCDDSLENLEIGKQYGWRTIWFQSRLTTKVSGTVVCGHPVLRSFADLKGILSIIGSSVLYNSG